jgi:hypothetical protein
VTIIQNILPVTVVAAILLFIAREIIDLIKRKKSDRRKIYAAKSLIARECELNHWTINSLRNIINTIKEERNNSTVYFAILRRNNGELLLRAREEGEDHYKYGSAFPIVHSEQFKRFLYESASIDKNIFNLLLNYQSSISGLSHIREQLIYFIEPEDEADKIWLDGFLDYAERELSEIFEETEKVYRLCANKDLEDHRLR